MWPAWSLVPAGLLAAGLCYGGFGNEAATLRQTAHQEPVWSKADVVDADSPRAQRYLEREKKRVRLPDSSIAAVALRDGRPSALLLRPSNGLDDRRGRAMQAGAVLDQDRSLRLPTTTDDGERIDFVIQADGETRASAIRSIDAAQR